MFLTVMSAASTSGSKPSSASTAARTSLVLLTGSLLICLHPFAAAGRSFTGRRYGLARRPVRDRRALGNRGTVVPRFLLPGALAVLDSAGLALDRSLIITDD